MGSFYGLSSAMDEQEPPASAVDGGAVPVQFRRNSGDSTRGQNSICLSYFQNMLSVCLPTRLYAINTPVVLHLSLVSMAHKLFYRDCAQRNARTHRHRHGHAHKNSMCIPGTLSESWYRSEISQNFPKSAELFSLLRAY